MLNDRPSPKNVFIIGATGYIGSAVAEAIHRAGHHVCAASRNEDSDLLLRDRGYEPVRADLRQAATLADHARRSDATIHVATTGTPDAGVVDAAATRAILAALRGTGKTFVYTSGVWTLGDTGETVVDEDAPNDRPLPSVAWRSPVEREVLDAAQDDVRSILLRPTIVYGRGGGITAMLAKEARETGVVRVIGDGRNEWTTVHIDDLADLYLRALEATAGSVLHGAHGPGYTVRDLAVAASVGEGKGGRTQTWSLDEAREELGDFADALALQQRVSAARTKALTGWDPVRPTVIEELLRGSGARPTRAPLLRLDTRSP